MEATTHSPLLRYRADHCSHETHVDVNGCSNLLFCNAAELSPEETGCILDFSLRIRNVSPGKRTAVAITLNEVDDDQTEHSRGMRTITLPAHNECGNRDILAENIRFILTGDTRLSGQERDGKRRLIVRTMAHYIDLNAACPYDAK